ncbi:MAG TPA: beta-ketoacyl synthase N-terminal-like domain-containing protein [Mucilaginibacter sp.]|nr:beta-ketoacyl synthase N-terminal-like domain-containing protein [Mucilaginibacter sp.]
MNRKSEPDVFIVADNVLSPLGNGTKENFAQLKKGVSAVRLHKNNEISDHAFSASIFNDNQDIYTVSDRYTKFEQLLIASVEEAIAGREINIRDKKTVLIISSTKGNISLLEREKNSPELRQRIALSTSARLVGEHFGFQNTPVIVSNACISGVLAIITGMRLLREGRFDQAVICGADVVCRFVVSGFQSFQALSGERCKPFDKLRDGLNLGEGAATIVLSVNKKHKGKAKVKGGSVSNDANHISGPSRTGNELAFAVNRAMTDAKVQPAEIGFVSAHGTATPYNDEMEAKAIALSGLSDTPVNSLKGYYGHTLGAAGLIESVISIESLRQGVILPSLGYHQHGVSSDINICSSVVDLETNNFVKTASGFGGCNAAAVFGK